MQNRIPICVGLLLCAAGKSWAQDPPPPGFAPAEDGPAADDAGPANTPNRGSFFSQYSAPPPDTNRPSYVGGDQGAGNNGAYSGVPFRPEVPYQSQNTVPIIQDAWPSPRLWLKAEALYWWTKAAPVPVPLVTLGDPGDPIPGALGQPGTSLLMGNQDVTLPGRGGGRFTLGFTLDPEQVAAFEAAYFFVGTSSASQNVFSDGSPASSLLAIPFFDPIAGGESATFLSRPTVFAGSALLTVDSFFQRADANLLVNFQNSAGWRFDALGGFRYLNLQENLQFQTNSPSVTANDVFQTFDHFQTTNNFYGGQLGARVSYDNGRLFASATQKLALGAMQEYVSVNGATFTNDFNGFGPVQSFPGGYFAQPTNMGSQSRTAFAVVPETNLNLGIRMSPWATFIVGYTFLYVSSVARPGDQIDRVINSSQAPSITGNPASTLVGPARPSLGVHDSDFWVQGLNFSVEFRY